MAKRRPAIWFYVWDWLNDRDLRACSLEARAVMMDFVCIAHDSEQYGFYGFLCLGGGEISDPFSDQKFLKSASFLFGLSPTILKKYLKELTEKSVLRQDKNGFVFCARMVRDEEERLKNKRIKEKRAAGGSRGGNPELIKPKDKKDNLEVNLSDGDKPVPSSSSPSSSPSKIPPTTTSPPSTSEPSGCGRVLSEDEEDFIRLYAKYNTKTSKTGLVETLKKRALQRTLDLSCLDALRAKEREELRIEQERDEAIKRVQAHERRKKQEEKERRATEEESQNDGRRVAEKFRAQRLRLAAQNGEEGPVTSLSSPVGDDARTVPPAES